MMPYNRAYVSFGKLEEIGQEGRNSRVYRCHDEYLDAEIAVKEIDRSSGFELEEYFREARILYKSDHPNVVQVHYACEDDDNAYIAMPYYRNGSLKKIIEARYLTVREIIRYSTQFLSGLQNVHSKGLIHFDIKPDNIMISNRNDALLSDFGQSKFMDDDGIAEQPEIYIRHIAPEATQTDSYDNRFDIYQAGLTMYRMAIGHEGFESQCSAAENQDLAELLLNGRFPNRSAYPWHIPRQLIKTINKCLSVDPIDRYDSPIDIVNDLSHIDGAILDWHYEVTGTGRKWTLNRPDGSKKEVTIDPDGASTACTINKEGNRRRVTKYCKDNINKTELARFLKE